MEQRTSLTEIIEYIDPGSLNYQDWVNVGMALKLEGYPVSVWDQWSQKDFGRYHAGDCEKKWRSFSGSSSPVTGGTIVQMAMERGWVPEKGHELDWNDSIQVDNGKVTECAFTFQKTVARKKYVQVQIHRLEETENGMQYVIENCVLECQQGSQEGKELKEEEWKLLSPFRYLPARIETGSPEPQYVIDRLNIVNNADEDESNPMGIAIYANAIDVLKKLDIEYDSYTNEFDLGRKRIFVAPEMVKNVDGSLAFDPEDAVFYQLPDNYDKDKEGLIKEINMDLRADEHSKAINDDLNYLSLKCGFGTERYKFDCSGVKTATEVISENSDMYRMIKKHEVILEDVLKELVKIIIRLGIVLGNQLNLDAEATIDFDDSIIEDKEAERQSDRQDVAMGAMPLWEYRSKYYAETEEQAKKNVQQPEETAIE